MYKIRICLIFFFVLTIQVVKGCNKPWYEPRHDKTNKVTVHPAKTQIRLGIHPVWTESSLCAQWVAKDLSFLHADSGDSDLTGQAAETLIWVFAACTAILLVLSCPGSNNIQISQFNSIFESRKFNKVVISSCVIFTELLGKNETLY